MALRRLLAVSTSVIAALALAVLGAPAQAAVGDPITVSGTVVDADGQPLAGVTLMVSIDGATQWVETDETGFYTATGAATGPQSYASVMSWVGPAGIVCDRAPFVSAPAEVTVNCFLPRYVTVTVSGTATSDNGKSPVGSMISLHDAQNVWIDSAYVDTDGTFQVVAQVRDTVTELYLSGGYGVPEVGPLGPVVDGAVFDGLQVVVHPMDYPIETDMTVQGRVLDKKGKPIAGANVGVGGHYNGVTGTTDENGYYSVTAGWPWSDENPGTEPVIVTIDGVFVEYIEDLNPYTPTVVDYRVGKTRVYEVVADNLDMGGDYPGTLYRQLPKDGPAEWFLNSPNVEGHFVFGDKKTEFLGVLPFNEYAGVQEILLRDVHDGVVDWYRSGSDGTGDFATFGYKKLDGLEYFDLIGFGGSTDVVAWGDRDGVTSVWTWAIASGLPVQEVQIDGKFVSAKHLELNADPGEEMVVVTRHGKNYTVTMLPSATEEPVTVATGRGEPTVTYTDADADGVFDVSVTFPSHH